MMEPGSLQWCLVPGAEAMGTTQSTRVLTMHCAVSRGCGVCSLQTFRSHLDAGLNIPKRLGLSQAGTLKGCRNANGREGRCGTARGCGHHVLQPQQRMA